MANKTERAVVRMIKAAQHLMESAVEDSLVEYRSPFFSAVNELYEVALRTQSMSWRKANWARQKGGR